jgi:ATP-binding cassette subfamily F protein 3
MSIVVLSNIRKEFIEDVPLFRDVSLAVGAGEKAALIGANGTGKTTLLRMIAGLETPDGGSIWLHPHVTVGYLAQDADLPEAETALIAVSRVTAELRAAAEELAQLEMSNVQCPMSNEKEFHARFVQAHDRFEHLGGYEFERRAAEMLCHLGFKVDELQKPVRVLSGGQKTRAALARLLLTEPDLLLLDEPTNHLDIAACEWLQEFLNGYRGAALIVSHDRYFLDQVVRKVITLAHGQTVMFAGNFSQTAAKRAALRESEQKHYELQQREIERMEEMVARLRRWAGKGGSLWGQVFSKEKALAKLKAQQVEKPKSDPRAMKLNVTAQARGGNEVLEIKNLRKAFPKMTNDQCPIPNEGIGHWSLDIGHLLVLRGQRVGIVGPNGSGKTTLLKMIVDIEPPTAGSVRIGANVTPAYFAQDFSHLRPQLTVLEEFVDGTELKVKEARHLLAKYLFTGEDVFKPVGVLSGGERCRLALGKLLLRQPNLLLLDEPTNHLDIVSREVLEDALRDFDGTMLMASHDRYFLDALATRIVEIKDGAARTFDGSYSQYRQTLARETQVNPKSQIPNLKPQISNLKLDGRRQRASERAQRANHRQRIKEVEDEIALLETQLSIVSASLANPDTYRSGDAKQVTQDYESLTQRLNELYREWEELMEEG